jgi:hypothetical protein
MEHWCSDNDRGTRTTQKKKEAVPLPLCPPQTTHGLAWDQTLASAVRDQSVNYLSHGIACVQNILCDIHDCLSDFAD